MKVELRDGRIFQVDHHWHDPGVEPYVEVIYDESANFELYVSPGWWETRRRGSQDTSYAERPQTLDDATLAEIDRYLCESFNPSDYYATDFD